MSEEKIKITPEILLNAYCSAMFPMAETRTDKKDLMWFSPEQRALIPIDEFHISRTLRKQVKRDNYKITYDKDFDAVIRSCADIRGETWINDEIIALYNKMHELGFAHSVEIWNKGDDLIGGLYGISIGGAFFGESMFSKQSNASKIALVHLVARLKQAGFILLDAQFDNEHLHQFGMYELPREEYVDLLHKAVVLELGFYENYSLSINSSREDCVSSSSEPLSDSSGLCSSINSSSSELLTLLQSITQTS